MPRVQLASNRFPGISGRSRTPQKEEYWPGIANVGDPCENSESSGKGRNAISGAFSSDRSFDFGPEESGLKKSKIFKAVSANALAAAPGLNDTNQSVDHSVVTGMSVEESDAASPRAQPSTFRSRRRKKRSREDIPKQTPNFLPTVEIHEEPHKEAVSSRNHNFALCSTPDKPRREGGADVVSGKVYALSLPDVEDPSARSSETFSPDGAAKQIAQNELGIPSGGISTTESTPRDKEDITRRHEDTQHARHHSFNSTDPSVTPKQRNFEFDNSTGNIVSTALHASALDAEEPDNEAKPHSGTRRNDDQFNCSSTLLQAATYDPMPSGPSTVGPSIARVSAKALSRSKESDRLDSQMTTNDILESLREGLPGCENFVLLVGNLLHLLRKTQACSTVNGIPTDTQDPSPPSEAAISPPDDRVGDLEKQLQDALKKISSLESRDSKNQSTIHRLRQERNYLRQEQKKGNTRKASLDKQEKILSRSLEDLERQRQVLKKEAAILGQGKLELDQGWERFKRAEQRQQAKSMKKKRSRSSVDEVPSPKDEQPRKRSSSNQLSRLDSLAGA